ncbi:MAG: PDDEXK nuclease domain-containing protein [Prevotellaceae bacterium]|jgi:predicted nuclease of restriction endonuclease-like (RecB) superfamily|nr:PDDEXK nuclease domain-containing protein [Prevotellaceae bacterium]
MNEQNHIASTQEFEQVHGIIALRRSRALQAVNNEHLLTAWEVGAYVSARLKNSAWGSKTVMQLSEYLRAQDPTLRGFGRSNIYSMVLLYDTYSSIEFLQLIEKLKLNEFVPPMAAQIEDAVIVQPMAGQLQMQPIVQIESGQLVQIESAPISNFLNLTSLSNHFEIIKEKRLQNGILSNMKDFILELGKDFLFYAQELPLQVGTSTFKVDLVFFHRGLQCLVAIELKAGKFKPEYMGQLEFYLEALDRDMRRSNENPSMGILLCQEADHSIVEYAMSRSLSPTMIAEYERQLIPKEVLTHSLEEFTAFLKPKKNIINYRKTDKT